MVIDNVKKFPVLFYLRLEKIRFYTSRCVFRFGALFFITVNQCFSSLSSAELFITERKLFMYVQHRSLFKYFNLL